MIIESDVKASALDWFQSHGYRVAFRPDISPEVELPKLISGELRFSDAEKFIEEAGCQ